jgi:hypothetical protein
MAGSGRLLRPVVLGWCQLRSQELKGLLHRFGIGAYHENGDILGPAELLAEFDDDAHEGRGTEDDEAGQTGLANM